ncbi:flippase [Haloarcula marina]|uniref:flippase n=1 Tax=Haloarcula marina TaxID=2961574 RepID=UPI0020B67659|nr:flippase [Halomicroarcula marina]
MSLKDELASRFRAQLVSKFITAAAGAALSVGLARLLDPSNYGVLFLALTVASTFQLVARFGIARSAGRYIAEYRETDPTQIPHIVRTSLLFNVGSILLAGLVLVASHRYIATLLNESALVPFLLLGTLFMVFGTLVAYLEKVIQGFEDITFVAVLRAVGRVSRVLLALGLVVAGFGATGALWGYVISSLLASVVGFVYLARRARSFYDATATAEPGLRRRIAEYAVPIMATNTSIVLDKRIDTLLVGFFLSPVAVSYYVVSEKVVSFVLAPTSALSFTISPTFGSEKAAGNLGRISRIYEETVMNALLLYAPAGAGLVLVAEPLITLVFGAEYSGAVAVLRVLGLYVILTMVMQISDNGLDYLGRARERAIARLVTAVLNVGLNVALIPVIGVVGAAIATVATRGLYTAANVAIITQELDLRAGFVLRRLGLIAFITATMSVVVFTLIEYITGWVTLVAVVAVGVVVWGALSLVTGLLETKQVLSFIK